MTEFVAMFSNLTNDNRTGENVEAVLFSIQESQYTQDVQQAYQEIYNRHPSYQKRTFNHQNIEESMTFLKSFHSEVPGEHRGEPIQIKLTIDDQFEALNLNELSDIYQNSSLVLLFIKKDAQQFHVHWKLAGMDYFLRLKNFDLIPDLDYVDFFEFVGDFLLNSLRFNHIGFHLIHNRENNEIDLNDMSDHQYCNLFQNAAEEREVNVISVIIKHNTMDLAKDMPSSPFSPQALALRNGHLNVFLMLIKAGYTYPPYIDINRLSDEIKEFVDVGFNMHLATVSRNKKKVKEILTNYPKQKHYFDLKNQSALFAALMLKFFDIYEILLSNGVELSHDEEFFEFLTPREKQKLTDIHFRCSKNLQDSHIHILMMNTTISHDDNNNEGKEQYIKKAYEVLNRMPSTKVILEAVAASKKFEIVFDFKRDSVHMVDLNAGKETKGIFHSAGKICVGAKQLLDPGTEHETFGTLVHEMCHHALHLTYNNVCKPYLSLDYDRKFDFEEINKFCKKNVKDESLIKMVYDNYNEDVHHAELAVRAPHLIAQYYNNPERLQKVKENYKKMFEYYEDLVVPDITEALPRIRKQAERMSSDKIIFICFIISFLLMGFMGFLLYSMLYNPCHKYASISELDQTRVRTATVKFKNVDINLWNLYPNNTKIYENLTCEHMTQIFNNEKLDLSDSKFTYLTDSVFFSWTNLTKPLKDKFLSSTILFQGQNVKLKDLYDVYPIAFKSLISKQIMTVLDGHFELSIGKMKELSTKFYVKRKFIPENSIVAQIEYEKTAFGANKSFKSFYESRPKANLTSDLKKHRGSYGSHVANSVDRISEYAAIGKLMGYKDFHKSFEKDTEDSRIFVLSSEAGAGKTVTFKHLAIELKKQHPTKWVSYIDLKDHVTWYQDDLLSGGIEELLKKILNLTTENEFERKIFEDSYKAGQVVLLWNGFDEISPLYETFILKVTKDVLEKTNNTQYICTRPSHSTQLNENFNVDSQMLVPFNEDEQIEFLNEYFKAKNIKNASIVNEMVSRVLNVTKKLIFNEKRQYDTPLLLSMFAEVKTDNPNLYEIFNNFVNKKHKIYDEKNIPAGKNLLKNPPNSNFNIFKIYQHFAVKIDIFPFVFSTHPAIPSLDIFKKLKLMPQNYADVSRTGMLYIHDKSKFEFAHKTYAEFFIAQYLIDNIYNDDSSSDENEIDARLEMLFLTIQFAKSFNIVIDFVMDYIKDDKDMTPFSDKIVKILKNKYKKHLLYILNKPYKDSFKFFFEFFKKDKELMLDMLKVHENETFYTALFNPFYVATDLIPEHVKNIVEPYLTQSEFNNFTNGQNQKAVMLYGIFDRKEFDKLKVHNLTITSETSFWEFFDLVKPKLTQEEQKQMFLNPIVTFIYRKYSASNDTNQKFWSEVTTLFDKKELTFFIGNLFPQLFRPKLEIPSDVESRSLDMLVRKTEQLLTTDEISEMAEQTHLIFKSARSFPQLQIVWDFVVKHTKLKDRKKLLTYDFRKSSSSEHQQFYSMYYKFFVMTPKVLHVNMFADNFTGSIDFVEKIYNETFKKSEIRAFFSESNNFLFPLIFIRPIEACEKFAAYLERLYKGGNEDELVKLIEKHFNDTELTIFEYFDNILAFAFKDRDDVKKKIRIFSDLRNKLKNVKRV